MDKRTRSLLLILLLSCLAVLFSCGTVRKVEETVDRLTAAYAVVHEKVQDLDKKLDEKGQEVATLGEQLRQEMGKETLTKEDVPELLRKVATTPSLWALIREHWDEFLMLLAALGVGGTVTKKGLKVAGRRFSSKAASSAGASGDTAPSSPADPK